MMTSHHPITLGEIAAGLNVPASDPVVVIADITLNSQSVTPGSLFVALPGSHHHGMMFIEQAMGAGAVAVWTDVSGAPLIPEGFPAIVSHDIRADLGWIAAKIYGDPTQHLNVVGVTGTQGKTTTTYLAESAARGAGVKPAIVGTIGTTIDGRPVESALTTPEAPSLQALFADMVDQRVDVCAMEVSSHALIQGRVDGVEFDVSVFLNLGRDHLDFHSDLDEYFAAKSMLFTERLSKRGIVDVDDGYGSRLAKNAPIPIETMSVLGNPADWMAVNIRPDRLGSRAELLTPSRQSFQLYVPLVGAFNVANAVAAVASLSHFGYDIELLCEGISQTQGIPGRMQRIDAEQDFLVIVDYAHKPDAVEAVLHALRPVTIGRLIVVLGAGGDRDRGKRPIMGEIAARDADVLIVTDDNPRSEDPAVIRGSVIAGARSGHADIVEIGDRREAIEKALEMAREGDTIVIAGKGHETGQEIGGVVHHFDDREIVTHWLEAQR